MGRDEDLDIVQTTEESSGFLNHDGQSDAIHSDFTCFSSRKEVVSVAAAQTAQVVATARPADDFHHEPTSKE